MPEIVDVLPEINSEVSSPEDDRTNPMTESNSQPDQKSAQSVSTFGTLGNINEDEEEANFHLLAKRDSGIMNSSTNTICLKDSELRNSLQEAPLVKVAGIFSWGDENYLTVREIHIPRGKLDNYK